MLRCCCASVKHSTPRRRHDAAHAGRRRILVNHWHCIGPRLEKASRQWTTGSSVIERCAVQGAGVHRHGSSSPQTGRLCPTSVGFRATYSSLQSTWSSLPSFSPLGPRSTSLCSASIYVAVMPLLSWSQSHARLRVPSTPPGFTPTLRFAAMRFHPDLFLPASVSPRKTFWNFASTP